MDLTTAFSNIQWWSVLLAAVSSFLIGGIWYGPLFGRAWMAEFGFTEEDLKKRNMAKIFGGSFLLIFFATLVLEMFIGAEADAAFGAMAGFLAGVGWVATFMGVIYLFEMRSFRAFFINAGYCVISLTVIGLILGVW